MIVVSGTKMLCFLANCNKTLIPKSFRCHLESLSSNFSKFGARNMGSSSSNSLLNQQKTSTLADLLNSHGIEPSRKPVSTIKYFERFGFSDTQIKTIISKAPSVLFFDVSGNHEPKIDFLQSIGLSQQDVIKIVTSDPYILSRSLHNHLIPSFDVLKHYYGGQEIATDRIKRWPPLFRCKIHECLPQNVKTLRDFGVPETRVMKMVAGFSCCRICADTNPHYFRKVVTTVMGMGFDPSSTSFEYAVYTMGWYSEQGWLKKIKLYKSLGFSEGEIHDMFKKQPFSLLLSEKKIRAAIKFYFEKFHWSPSHVLKAPNALMYSLEKRVVPRCSVVQVLVSRNKVNNAKILSLLAKTEKEFLERYVNNYKDEIPEVLDAYQGKITFDDFNFGRE